MKKIIKHMIWDEHSRVEVSENVNVKDIKLRLKLKSVR